MNMDKMKYKYFVKGNIVNERFDINKHGHAIIELEYDELDTQAVNMAFIHDIMHQHDLYYRHNGYDFKANIELMVRM